MSFELVLGILTFVIVLAILTQLKRLNVVFSILFFCGMTIFAGLVITLIAAAAGTDSLMISQSNPPW